MRKRTIDIESSRCECVVNNAISHHFIIGNILQNCLRPVSARTQVVLLVFHLCFAALLQKFIYIFFWSSSNYLSHFVHIAIADAMAIAFGAQVKSGSFSVCHLQLFSARSFLLFSSFFILLCVCYVSSILILNLSTLYIRCKFSLSKWFEAMLFSCFRSESIHNK